MRKQRISRAPLGPLAGRAILMPGRGQAPPGPPLSRAPAPAETSGSTQPIPPERQLERAALLGHDIARILPGATGGDPRTPAAPAPAIRGTPGGGAVQRRDMRAVMIDQRARENTLAQKEKVRKEKAKKKEKLEEAPPGLTTVGFEWDVATTVERSSKTPNVLQGLTHVELAESDLQWNGLPYLFETDAGNVLEFVTPPFYLRTQGPGSSLPDPEDLNDVIDSTREALTGLVAKGDTIARLLAKDWAPFAIGAWNVNDLAGKIDWRNWSDRALSQDDIASGIGAWQQIPISAVTLDRSPQINIAATSSDYAEAQGAGESRLGKSDSYVADFNKRLTKIEQQVVTPCRPVADSGKGISKEVAAKINRALDQLTQVLAQQYVVASIEKLAATQQEGFTEGPSSKIGNAMRAHSGLPSYIKDTGVVWLKTDLFSYLVATLPIPAWGPLAGDRGILAAIQKKLAGAKSLGASFDKKPLAAVLDTLRGQVDSVTDQKGESKGEIRQKQEKAVLDQLLATGKKLPKFNEHNAEVLGVRQDTFIKPSLMVKLSQRLGFKSLLSVMEVRNTDAFLEWLKTGLKSEKVGAGSDLGGDVEEEEAAPTIDDGNGGQLHANVTEGDGNCFFHALYESRNSARSNGPAQLLIRQSVLQALAGSEAMARSHFGARGVNSPEYLYFAQEMVRNGAWVTDQTPAIVSDALNLRIVIHNPNGTIYYDAQPNATFHGGAPVVVHVQYTGNHYNSYTPAAL